MPKAKNRKSPKCRRCGKPGHRATTCKAKSRLSQRAQDAIARTKAARLAISNFIGDVVADEVVAGDEPLATA